MRRARIERFIETVFGVRPAELRLTALMAAQCLCTVGAFVIGRSVRDALFMAHRSSESLALMYVISAGAVSLAGLLFARLSGRALRGRLTLALCGTSAAGLVLVYLLLPHSGPWIYSLLYVAVEVVGALTIMQFWTLANDIFTSRDARRLFGTIGAGGVLASVVFGSLVGGLARRIGSEGLLPVSAGLLLLAAFFSTRAGRRLPVRLSRPRAAAALRRPLARVFDSPHLKSLAVLAGLTFFTTTLIDFEFKVMAARSFEKDALTAWFGRFYAICGGLSLVVQVFVTPRLLARAGVVAALGLLPLFLGTGSLAMLLAPGLWAAVLAKGSDSVLRYTVNDATTQLLYLPVPGPVRASAKTFIDGTLKPLAIGLSGLALLGYRHWFGTSLAPVAVVATLCSAAWGLMLVRLRGQYVGALQDSLRHRRLDLEGARHRIADGATARMLVTALQSPRVHEVLNALELLPHLKKLDVDGPVEKLLEHPAPEVRIAALGHLARRRALHLGNAVFYLFDDPDPGVRAAAIETFCAIGRDKSVRNVRGFLTDPAPEVRAAAITGMIRFGGLDGVLSAAGALKELITHAEPAMRQHAARVLGAIGVRNFYQPVLELMADRDLSVRRAAIESAGRLKSQELLPALVYRLAREDTAADAGQALVSFGAGTESTLARVLENHLEEAGIRRNVPRVLGRLGTAAAVEVLAGHLDDPDGEVRQAVYRALAHVQTQRRGLSIEKRALLHAIDRELARAWHTLGCAEMLGLGAEPGPSTPRTGPAAAEAMLTSALRDKVEQCQARIFTLLGVLHPRAEIQDIHAGYRSSLQDAPRLRANALELLDNLLDRRLKLKLLPLLDDAPRESKLRAASAHYPLPGSDAESCLASLLVDENRWVRACALQLAGERPAPALIAGIRRNLVHPWEVVREAAVVALQKVLPPGELAQTVAPCVRDDSPSVALRVQAILAADEASRRQAG